MKKFFSTLILLTVATFLIAGCGEKYDKDVMFVREGTLYMAPTVPVGKAFDQFFTNGTWRSFTSTDNEKIVEFKGDCTWNDEPARATVQFVINGNEFQVKYFGINGSGIDDFSAIMSIEKILDEYKP